MAASVTGARAAPFKYAINAVAGVLLGPWCPALSTLVTAALRVSLGAETPFAFVGSPFWAVAVGLAWRLLRRRDEAALFEPLGTVLVGAPLGALLIAG